MATAGELRSNGDLFRDPTVSPPASMLGTVARDQIMGHIHLQDRRGLSTRL